MVLKGILDPEDARTAAKAGVQAIVASDHGGRQFDGALSTAAALPAIVNAVRGEVEIIFDGGIRSGQDVFLALALGAGSCMIGEHTLTDWGPVGSAAV
jgi:L-lactate dehydrogenase (cytochrome)